MLTFLGINIIGLVAIILMIFCIMNAVLAIILMYTGRAMSYDRAGKKMAKAGKKSKKK